MTFTFQVTVDVERVSGKFASRDDIAEQLAEWLENCNEGSIEGIGADFESEYEVASWDIEQVTS